MLNVYNKSFLALTLILTFVFSFTQSFSQEETFEIGGYGDLLYQHYDYGPNRKASQSGSLPDDRSIVDLSRFVLELEYKFTSDIELGTEIEFEHGGTGSAMELEYEEFGEYEPEIEKGGEVVIEQLHLTKEFSEAFNLRAGHFIVQVGQLNHRHRPKSYFTTIRSEGESSLLPVTWHETGVEMFGKVSDFNYHLQLVNGLDASGFSSEHWIKEGNQKSFELTNATNMALAGRLEYTGIKGLNIGISGYRGNSTGNASKPKTYEGIDGHVTIGAIHGTYKGNNIIARGNYLIGTIENADLISQKNASLSRNIQYPRTPVAKGAKTWAFEAGYNVLALLTESNSELYTFLRYEYYNSMEEVDESIYADKRFKRNVFTFGLNYLPISNIVVKLDYSMRTLDNGNYNDENTIGLSVSFVGTFFKD